MITSCRKKLLKIYELHGAYFVSAGGILTTLTAGAAAPVLIAGLATSSVGAATNIGDGRDGNIE